MIISKFEDSYHYLIGVYIYIIYTPIKLTKNLLGENSFCIPIIFFLDDS